MQKIIADNFYKLSNQLDSLTLCEFLLNHAEDDGSTLESSELLCLSEKCNRLSLMESKWGKLFLVKDFIEKKDKVINNINQVLFIT